MPGHLLAVQSGRPTIITVSGSGEPWCDSVLVALVRRVYQTVRPRQESRRLFSLPAESSLWRTPRTRRHIMKLGLINSAWAQAGRDTAYGIRMTREIGFDSIDIFTDPLDIDIKERRLIKRECDKAGLPIVSVACVAVGPTDV